MNFQVKRRTMWKVWLVLCMSLCIWGSFADDVTPGSCATSCHRSKDENSEKYRCSCSSSCVLYKDCCYDSPFRNEGPPKSMVSTVCLPSSSIGGFLAVNSCADSWKGPREACANNLGHLRPVYSLNTGTTYTNIYCAMCNSESNVTEWKTDIECCGSTEKPSEKVEFVMRYRTLWRLSYDKENSPTTCRCTFRLSESRESFLSKTEVRSCKRSELSQCSVTWKDNDVRRLCESYLDPLYLWDKTYRNIHCAICNYENKQGAACVPSMMNIMHEKSFSREQMIRYCKERHLNSCLHYLSTSKGRTYTFSDLVSIEFKRCLPPAGRRCCDGEIYDFQYKRCRKLS